MTGAYFNPQILYMQLNTQPDYLQSSDSNGIMSIFFNMGVMANPLVFL